MENKLLPTIGKIYFMIVAVMMYYFITEVINLGIFVSFRHAFALLLFASAFAAFLYKPNIARGIAALKATFVYCTPLIVTLAASLFIWYNAQVETSVIFRGLSSLFLYSNMLSFTLAAVAFLYVFGEKGVWYNLIAILISNILMIFTIMINNGIGAFFSEFITLIVTFAAQTGDIIVKAEIHELAFCTGAYLIYMLLKPKKDIIFLILLFLTGFCFLAAFKRIGIIAVAFAIVLGWFLRFAAKIKKDTAIRLMNAFALILMIILIGYVAVIKLDLFALLEEIGISTSGRMDIYRAVDKFYEFSPEFLGNGIGFLTYQLSTNMSISVTAVHNDFLQYFIDLGFWGYILWLASMTVLRVGWFGAKGNADGGITALSLTVYLAIVSSTDNTMNFPLLTTVLGIIMIGQGFDDRVRSTEEKLFGYISEPNRKKEGDLIL